MISDVSSTRDGTGASLDVSMFMKFVPAYFSPPDPLRPPLPPPTPMVPHASFRRPTQNPSGARLVVASGGGARGRGGEGRHRALGGAS